MHAVIKENVDMVKFLLSKGADKSITNNSGETALNWASQKNNSTITALLLN
jgi:ankyrin repeat protein